MRLLRVVLAGVCLVAFLSACGDIHEVAIRPEKVASVIQTDEKSEQVQRRNDNERFRRALLASNVAAWNGVIVSNALAANKNAADAAIRKDADGRRAASFASPSSPGATSAAPSGCAYDALIRSVFGTAGDWAVSIAMRESRCTPTAVSPDNALGLFQLLGHSDDFIAVGCDPSQWSDPSCNVRAAFHLYERAGTSPWSL